MSSIMKGLVDETEAKKGADGKRCWKGKRYAGTENGKDKCIPVKNEAANPAQQAAIAINMKKKGQKPKNVDEAKAKQYVKPYIEDGKQVGWKSSDGYHVKYWRLADSAKAKAYQHAKLNPDEVQEDYTGEFAAEKTPETNPYGGQRDRQHRGAISETPTDNPTGASGEGGWRKYKPKSAGTFKEEQLDEKCWDTHKQVGMKTKGGKQVPNCVPKESAIMKGLKR
jgi:hypothetical protein